MKERDITITLKEAREWFASGNAALKELALRAFSEDELVCSFKDIKTFKDACKALGLIYDIEEIVAKDIARVSRASAAMFKLNIIRKALNFGQALYLTKKSKNASYIYYPYNPFLTKSSISYKNELDSGKMEIIGEIKSEEVLYNVLGGHANFGSGNDGLGGFNSDCGTGDAFTAIGFLGCASKEIAQHFGKYFGMLITKAKYGDIVDFEIIEDKYGNTK